MLDVSSCSKVYDDDNVDVVGDNSVCDSTDGCKRSKCNDDYVLDH